MLIPLLLAALVPAAQDAAPAQPWLELPAGSGPGAGRHIVLVSGDEEYRSEEALPMLAQILARHGFHCTVLFAIDKRDGTVNPEERGNIPGLAALDDADLLVLFTRFRCLPDADMQHLVDYVRAGKPVFGIRTATHAFAYDADSTSRFKGWSWDSSEPKGGFGQEVFGTTWVAHLGNHGHESTRGVVPEAAHGLPMMRGVADVWGATDVYAVPPLPADATVLLEGSILAGMTPGSPAVEDARNAPRTPVTWIREIPRDDGSKQRVACSTIGAAVDLKCEDLRRLFVNLCCWCVGAEKEIPEKADVTIVGSYEPTMFGFGGYRKGLKPADFLGRADEAQPAR
jgi:hypothetical protein